MSTRTNARMNAGKNARMNARRRVSALMMLAAVASAGLVTSATSPVAEAASSKSTTVLVVHGFDGGSDEVNDLALDSQTVCNAGTMQRWSDGLRERGWTDVRTVGYYAGDDCDLDIPWASRWNNTVFASLDELGLEFAWLVYNNFTVHGRPVAISAHSMGGLVVRRALAGVQGRQLGFPPGMWVQDVVTQGTAHGGAPLAAICPAVMMQCEQMQPLSLFLAFLGHNPQGRDRNRVTQTTDWTLLGSACDEIVSGASATSMSRGSSGPSVFKQIFPKPAGDPNCTSADAIDHTGMAESDAVLDRVSTSLENRD